MSQHTESREDFFVFTFDLMNRRLSLLPKDAAHILASPALKAAIEQQVILCSTNLLGQHDALRYLQKCGEQTLVRGGQTALDIYLRRVQSDLSRIGQRYKISPLGAWVDDNATLLIIAGSALTIGGLATAWHFKNDLPNEFIQLSGFGGYQKVYGGAFDLRVGGMSFQPSQDSFSFGARAERMRLRPFDLDLGFLVRRDHGVMKLTTREAFQFPLKGGFLRIEGEQEVNVSTPQLLRLNGQALYTRHQLQVGLQAEYNRSGSGPTSSVSGSLSTPLGGTGLHLGGRFDYRSAERGGTDPDVGASVSVGGRF